MGYWEVPSDQCLYLVPGRLGQAPELAGSGRSIPHNLVSRVLFGRNGSYLGLKYRDLSGVKAIGIDEIQWRRGQRHLTLVYQIDAGCRRLLWIGNKRSVKTLLGFFHWLGKNRTANLRYICSDMCKPYLKVIAKKAGNTIHILDRFHIMAHLGKAIDEVRAKEVKELKDLGGPQALDRS